MKTSILTLATLALATSATLADHVSQQVRLRGTSESPTGITAVTEANFVAAGNFMVVYYDLIPGTKEFTVQEWSDTNADGTPDTFVRDLFTATHVAALPNKKFAVNITDAVLPLGDSALSITGKVKVKDEDQIGFVGKVLGVLVDEDANGGDDVLFKGTMTTFGPIL
jgi:hypothetical protein